MPHRVGPRIVAQSDAPAMLRHPGDGLKLRGTDAFEHLVAGDARTHQVEDRGEGRYPDGVRLGQRRPALLV